MQERQNPTAGLWVDRGTVSDRHTFCFSPVVVLLMASMLWDIKTVFGCLVSTNWISSRAFKIYSTQTPWSQSPNANQRSLLSTQFPWDFHFHTQWDISQSLPSSFHYLCPLSTTLLESTSNIPVTPSKDHQPPHTAQTGLSSHLRKKSSPERPAFPPFSMLL